MTDTAPDVVATLDDETGDHSVDILHHADGSYTYVEYIRDADDPDAWHARDGGAGQSYKTEFAAYSAAMRDVDWLMD